MIRHLVTTSLLIVTMSAFVQPARGQALQQDYSVYVPPFMTLTQLFPDRTQNHPGTSADVPLGSSLWIGRTASNTGSTIRLATDTPFQNLTNPNAKRDAHLFVPGYFGFGNWSADTAVDQTDYAIGKNDAAVEFSSTGPGIIWIPLRVTFLTGNVNTLAGGTYQITVTGTITAN